ncbi:hypothetical protein ACVFYP_25110 [Roseomonas sp. F4]
MPGLTYLYLPVGSAEMMDFANDWNADLRRTGRPECPVIANTSSGGLKAVRRLFGNGMLKVLGTEDTLFVIAHGAARGSRRIGADRGGVQVGREWEGGVMKSWLAPEFARHLDKEGLRKDFVDLRLFACGSGLVAESTGVSYAEALWNAMRRSGYARLEMTGYLGSVRTSFLGQPVVEYAPRGGITMVPVHEACVHYPQVETRPRR